MSSVVGRSAALAAAGFTIHAAPALVIRRPFRQYFPRLTGAGKGGTVALTFDDGPDPRMTPALLDALSELSWPATFFMLGASASAHPDLARLVVAKGHDAGVHGLDHDRLLRMSPTRTMRELRVAFQSITQSTGVAPRWFRPTYGALSAASLVACAALRIRPVLWTAESGDWKEENDEVAMCASVMTSAAGGGTVLFHDAVQPRAGHGSDSTVRALHLLRAEFDRRGLQVVPLAEHLGQ